MGSNLMLCDLEVKAKILRKMFNFYLTTYCTVVYNVNFE